MTQNGVPRLRLSTTRSAAATTTSNAPESHAATSPTTASKQQRSAFVEGLKKTLRTPRLGRSRSERDVGATADVISGSLKNKNNKTKTTKTKTAKREKMKTKTRKMKGTSGAAAKTASDPMKPRGLAMWSELLLEEKHRNKSMGDVLVLMKKDGGAIERGEGSGVDEDEDDADPLDQTTPDSDGTGGRGYPSPLSPRHNPQALICAQRKAMDDLRSAHPHAFER